MCCSFKSASVALCSALAAVGLCLCTEAVKHLAEIADIFPHAAYAAFIHGLFGRWSYLMRTIPDIKDFLQPLEDVIHQSFIPVLFGGPHVHLLRETCIHSQFA